MNDWTGPIVKCAELTRFYPVGEGFFALKNVHLEISQGEFVVIMGPSGSGKSTLLNILGGIDRPTHGEVILQGRKYSRMSEDDLAMMRRREIGMVFQFFNLLPELNARENVGLPMRLAGYGGREIEDRVSYLLEAVKLTDREGHFPSELSGGEQQRVAIARALACRPAVILADEPTGNLDTANGREIMEYFSAFNKAEGQTFVVVTHEPAFREYADTVIGLVDGEVKERESSYEGKGR